MLSMRRAELPGPYVPNVRMNATRAELPGL